MSSAVTVEGHEIEWDFIVKLLKHYEGVARAKSSGERQNGDMHYKRRAITAAIATLNRVPELERELEAEKRRCAEWARDCAIAESKLDYVERGGRQE